MVLLDSQLLVLQEENDEATDDDPDMEGELTSADVRKLQSLVDEQEQAVQAGRCIVPVSKQL